ncbi:MAG TPA: glycosyltransferase, partial [Hydrogenothermaceae bacterium]|nr:glycosyltransferase [Hydrogenothermaceae bacterium]
KPQNELYKYYSQGSIFVLPSLEEGFAMVQFQAMACGLPLICTTNTGGEDLITKNGEEGFVIPIRNVEAIKEKILYLYNNQNICKDMGQKAKKKIEKGFSWDDYGNRYIKNLEKIMPNATKSK